MIAMKLFLLLIVICAFLVISYILFEDFAEFD